jgi:hypothetical protein
MGGGGRQGGGSGRRGGALAHRWAAAEGGRVVALGGEVAAVARVWWWRVAASSGDERQRRGSREGRQRIRFGARMGIFFGANRRVPPTSGPHSGPYLSVPTAADEIMP